MVGEIELLRVLSFACQGMITTLLHHTREKLQVMSNIAPPAFFVYPLLLLRRRLCQAKLSRCIGGGGGSEEEEEEGEGVWKSSTFSPLSSNPSEESPPRERERRNDGSIVRPAACNWHGRAGGWRDREMETDEIDKGHDRTDDDDAFVCSSLFLLLPRSFLPSVT